MIGVESILPRQKWPLVKTWWLRAILMNSLQVLISFTVGYYVDKYFSHYAFFHLDYANSVQIAIGYLTITFIYYWWHRLRHTPLFWNLFHQLHHSPSRLEIITAFYKHPLEIMANGVLSSAILYFLLGLSPALGTIVIAITGCAELFYHWNIKTPYWLGFIFQRPESHCVHHQRGKHYYNFSDLPIWDILFGTFYNPKASQFECGFSDNKELHLKNIFLFKNVNRKVLYER
jgi:sterol desaturase/sphingolipid hydroxylase (fatty acid hydroxylase superfamily)